VQTHGGAPAAAAIEQTGGKRYFYTSVLVDWARDGLFAHPLSDISSLVDEATWAQSITGSAPAEIMLVEGYAAAELQLTLRGQRDGLPVVALFSTYNGNSPLYTVDLEGCEIVYKIGVETSAGTVWYQQFIGNVRYVSPARRAESVVITALDRAEKMRQPVRLPIWAVGSYQRDRGWREAQLMESQWLIDHCLRTADASPTPMRPLIEGETRVGNNQFWMSGNGSWIPNIGYIDSARMQGFPKSEASGYDMHTLDGTPHPLVAAEAIAAGKRPAVLAAMGTDTTGFRPSYWPQYPGDTRNYSHYKQYHAINVEAMQLFASNWFGFRLVTRGQNNTWWSGASGDVMRIRFGGLMQAFLQFNAGQVRCRFENIETGYTASTPYITIPSGQDSVQIDCRIQPHNEAQVLVDGANAGHGKTLLANYGGTIPEDALQGTVYLFHRPGLQDVYWTQRNVGFSGVVTTAQLEVEARKPAKYPAILDRGLNRLSVTPQSTYEDGWALASAVAAAELGAVLFDKDGVFRFWNRNTITGKQSTVVRTLDLDDLDDLGNTSSLDSLRNIVTADAVVASSDLARVFEAGEIDQFVIPATTEMTFTFRVEDMAGIEVRKIPRYSTAPDSNVPDAWTDAIDHGYVVQFETADSVWQERNNFTSGVDIFAYVDEDYNLKIKIWNGYANDARFATNGGSPALRIQGTKVFQLDNIQIVAKDTAAIQKFGPRNLPISGDWVQQQPGVTTGLVDYILDRSVKAIPVTDEIPINGDPRLEIGDTVEVQDPDGLGESLLLQILGIRRTVSRTGGCRDTLTVELIRPSLVGLWDSAQYGRWDTTLIWGP
jgi:hypothetical protein